MTHLTPTLVRTAALALAAVVALGAPMPVAAATSPLAISSLPREVRCEALQLAYELEQPANMGSGLSIPGDVNVVGEGGFEAPAGEPSAPAGEGHRGVVVGAPAAAGSNVGEGIEAERAGEMEAREGRPMGIDGPSRGQIDLETPSAKQMELER